MQQSDAGRISELTAKLLALAGDEPDAECGFLALVFAAFESAETRYGNPLIAAERLVQAIERLGRQTNQIRDNLN